MASFILEKTTSLCLKIFQTLLLTAIFSLEFSQIQAFNHDESPHDPHEYYWLVIFITYISLLYYLTSFSYRWITGPHKIDIFIDVTFTLLWFIISSAILLSAHRETKFACHDLTSPTRCRLLLSSVSLSWIVMATYIVSLYISIMRWRNRPIEAKSSKFIEPPNVMHKSETYVVQKGVLAGGQPALIFHMAQKNASSPNLSKGGTSGNVSPTSSSHNANTCKSSIYLHGKDVAEV